MLKMTEDPATSSSLSVTDERAWSWYDRDNSLMNENENATSDIQLLLLKTLHDETLSNWTGSFDDPSFDYLNIPLVRV